MTIRTISSNQREASVMSNRPAPPHFRGFDLQGTVATDQRHWRQPRATYFVALRLADSVPRSVPEFVERLRLECELRSHEPAAKSLREEYERQARTLLESSLDEGHGACVLRDEVNIEIVRGRLAHGLDTQHFLGCGAVMPNDVQGIICPRERFKLEDILGQIKAYSAININSRIRWSGRSWQEESDDRIIRDEDHLYRVIQYIGRNPLKCGHPFPDSIRWVHPQWIAAGWGFEASQISREPTTG